MAERTAHARPLGWATGALAALLALLAFVAAIAGTIAAYALSPYASPAVGAVVAVVGGFAYVRSDRPLVRAVGGGACVGGLVAAFLSLFLVADVGSDTEPRAAGGRR